MAFNGSDFFVWMTCAAKALGTNEKLINDLNVFPVPDGDTGSNMRGTVADALAGTQPSVHFGQCAKAVSDKMLKSARGNSGTILSQYFCGFSSRLAGSGTVDFSDISEAMAMGTKQAYSAVSVPREGTVLSVMRAAGEYAAELCPNFEGGGPDFFDKICTEAEKALLLTKETLPILKEADVVDSGGLGFLTVLRGFVSAFSDSSDSGLFSSEITSMPKADFSAYSSESFTFRFCTECIVSKSADFLGS
ncbi:MAG: DAK2 domain-containing protein, partial [Clostridia bacterium]|nr:DAK2 domain-containing protein [Clostridia bacterium]